MPQSLAAIVARNTNTMPIYMSPGHAEGVLQQIMAAEPSALRSPGRLSATLRAIGSRVGLSPAMAFDDDEVVSQPDVIEAYQPLWMGEEAEELDWGMTLKDGIACLNLDTALSSEGYFFCGKFFHGYDSLNAALQSALDDPRVNGIFFRMDSPGGVVHDGMNVLTETIRAAEKPIWVYADMACSAAYWIAAQCPWIIAPSTGMVGSIGACIVHTEYSGLLKNEGIKVTGISWGRRKLDGSSFSELTDEALAHLQAFVDEAGEQFLEAVTTGRPTLSTQDVIDMEARWFAAQHRDPSLSGLELGLIDEIMSEQQAFEALVAMTETAPATGVSGGA